ncbi:helix-turn-helix domain-containing protein [Amycolatopsis sp. NPDC001319]|uniref:helix-turn-helix domain-containing protein n=1 Tax=unclassified Amycolatopsis TaxID=2618356 RepID=UPI0036AEA92F
MRTEQADGHHLTMVDGVAELAAFLRARREQIKPEDVGLVSHGRRRTPGLRREELATLAGISVEYLERLEQGRDTNPSIGILTALAEALRLSEDEKRHLAALAVRRQGEGLLPRHRPEDEVRPSLRVLLDRLGQTPACLLGGTFDVIAWNGAWESIVRPLGFLDHDSPNLLRYHFLHPSARRVFGEDWASTADELVGWLRAIQADQGVDAAGAALVDELTAVPDFSTRWTAHPVAYRRAGVTRLRHPDTGPIDVSIEILKAAESSHWLQVWVSYD